VASDIVLDVVERAVTLLTRHNVDYALVGGLALQPWGRLRSTLDVDLLLVASEQEIPPLQEALWEEGFIFHHAAPTDLGHVSLIQTYVNHADSGLEIRVDFLLAGAEFHRNVVQRKVMTTINSHTFCVASCEDLILLKLLAGRPIDRVDAAELWALNASELDVNYMRQWAASIGITAELEECVSQSN
jgi:hypothetical protein